MPSVTASPPRAPPIKYVAPLGTRWAKEKAAAGGSAAFDLPTDPKSIGPWILGECIGKGASGRVKLAKHRRTGQLAAVKILPIAPLVNSRASASTQPTKTDKQRLGIDREITMMKLMNHPNIMRIFDVYEGEKELFLVLEYVEGGELFDYLVNRGRLPPAEALAYFKQIVYGLNYAHTFSIIHRDLKPENILIASLEPPSIKIADWGMAAFAPPSLQLETSCGSPHYASPEIVNGEKYEGNATDIWSCGVILFALLTGRLPFDDKNVRTLLVKVKSGKYETPSWVDPLAKDLLSRMLVVDVNKRITIPEILSHPWLTSNANLAPGDMSLALPDPPLPPSPNTLAKPLSSPDEIDPELFASLRVIWGRHADPKGESIIRDLTSPAGQGVHAKTFYFLLSQYREDSRRNKEEEENADKHGTIVVSPNREPDTLRHPKRQSGIPSLLAAPGTYSRTRPSIPVPYTGPVPPVMSRGATGTSSASSRERPASPVGPRPLSTHFQKKPYLELSRGRSESPTSSRPSSPLSAGRSLPRPAPPRRGYTYSHPTGGVDRDSAEGLDGRTEVVPNNSVNRPLPVFLPQPKLEFIKRPPRNPSRPSSPTVVHPNAASVPPTLHSPTLSAQPGPDVRLPPLVAPKINDPALQNTLNQVAERVNEFLNEAEKGAAQPAPTSLPVRAGTVDVTRRVSTQTHSRIPSSNLAYAVSPRLPNSADKENEGVVSSQAAQETRRASMGLGLGVGRDVGKEMGNIVYLGDDLNSSKPAKPEKERKAKQSNLEQPPLSDRRSTLGSPMSLSVPPSSTTASHRLLASPVLGEFKGWFSNLFSWKSNSNGQGGILYSPDDVFKTRMDVGKFFESLGIIVEGIGFRFVEGDYDENPGTLKCRIEEPAVDSTTHLTLKPVKFRAEFSPAPTATYTTTGGVYGGSHGAAPASGLLGGISAGSPKLSTTGLSNSRLPIPTGTYTTHRSRASLPPRRISTSIGADASPLRSTTTMAAAGHSMLATTGNPAAATTAIVLIHEKGSLSTFRTIWRKLKAAYDSGSGAVGGYPSFSPAMMTTPVMEAQPRFVA
ncbi:hypothetical protein AX16_005983 [Volvariella volvacea WC 439]|nr:hypothetical protein AX16_005983 [Volvariella volvacea WC 439]